ncbi:hypothetical protein [Hamadaea tsunoensis]|uniref:hypothetical protein n=1 Tax=Hamadaea tsunoensis TaxID=53368 RepID=UPI00040EEFD0|nr:hypothetical protein [Hamadaea tsunoensis]
MQSWNTNEGWGVIVLDAGQVASWTHFSVVVAEPGAFRELTAGQRVECEYEVPGQDGYPARTLSARPA